MFEKAKVRLEAVTDKAGHLRMDGKYPERIYSTYCIKYLHEARPCYLEYITDHNDKPKIGTLVTSNVQNFYSDSNPEENRIIVSTMNSVYYFKVIEESNADEPDVSEPYYEN